MNRRKIRDLVKYIIAYALLIAFIIGLRLLHGLSISLTYYIVITSIILVLLIGLAFVEIKHVEKLFPESSRVGLMISLTLRFLPLAKQRISNIRQNQEMRGAKFKGFNQVKNYLSLLVPSVIVSIRWADNVSEGILMRGGD